MRFAVCATYAQNVGAAALRSGLAASTVFRIMMYAAYLSACGGDRRALVHHVRY